jgi:hypothetical protein
MAAGVVAVLLVVAAASVFASGGPRAVIAGLDPSPSSPAASHPSPTTAPPASSQPVPSATGAGSLPGAFSEDPGASAGRPLSGVPAAPSNLTGSVVGTTFVLHWQDNSSDEDGFHLGYPASGNATYILNAGGPNTTTFQVVAPVAGYEYCFAVRAYKISGIGYSPSSWSSGPKVCLTVPPPPPPTPPAAPSGVTATFTAAADAIVVTWLDNSTNEDGFEVNFTYDGSSAPNPPMVGQNVTTFTWTDIWAGPTFCFRIRAVNYSVGNSDWSAPACVSAAFLLPAAPSGLHLSALGGGAVRLEWTDNANNENGFHVMLYGRLGYVTVPADSVSYDWPGLTVGSEACFSVRSFNSHTNSSWTSKVCTTVA